MNEAPENAEGLTLARQALSVMRHDLRNLLASVTIMAARMEQSGDERLAKAAPLLVDSMERTVALGVRAGALAEAARGAPADVPLSRVLSLIETEGRLKAEGEDTVVHADEAQLIAMLGEVIANALAAGETVRLTARREGARVRVRVTDDGGGIADYARADLFTPFKGAKRRGGTGLGLPLAARLAELNDGALDLEETSERGTTFRFDLPGGRD